MLKGRKNYRRYFFFFNIQTAYNKFRVVATDQKDITDLSLREISILKYLG